jgi:hypothetical protein
MSNATIVPQPTLTLYHTNFAAFGDALHAVAPELFIAATEYRTHANGITFNEDEALGRAVHVLLAVVGPSDDDLDPDDDAECAFGCDYNDDELLHGGIQR